MTTGSHDTLSARIVELKAFAATRATHSRSFRMDQLKGLREVFEDYTEDIQDALWQDIGKSAAQTDQTEFVPVKDEISYAMLHLTDWMEPQPRSIPYGLRPGKAMVKPRPLGVVGIVGHWAHPFYTLLAPLVGAVAAGNCMVLKPSMHAPRTAKLLGSILPEYLNPRSIVTVTGGAEALDELVAQPLDHLFFTGSESLGRHVYQRAAAQLTPVTLQLGGKSPVIVVDGSDWKTIGRRIAYGKFTNAGQSLVSPDYLIAVGYDVAAKVQQGVIDAIEEFYGPSPGESKQFGRIITAQHTQRLVDLIRATTKGAVGATPARLVHGGKYNIESAFLAPTILADVHPNSAIMQEQILGPVLPILVVDTYDEAIEFANSKPTAPAAYLFSERRRIRKDFMHRINAGAAVMNATIIQTVLPSLPHNFTGGAGFGTWGGHESFRLFSQYRTHFYKPTRLDTLQAAYPPDPTYGQRMIDRLK
ncbi:aldehyde dehydrogenase family protein [Enteractinococcus coprophilus]|uniref:Aldehyde dehydrogenase n=1 Tax=Enteractinococcus coprophilus TaxID=1027633 RepID=A0A543APG1_9MICC|nr:aldehyde dehydrogenase family protein [Enteractinococcus coprophilus]TQL74467.1 aldehyde dehydrogenase (NAD+) [Enteractinococcus coprophilus]